MESVLIRQKLYAQLFSEGVEKIVVVTKVADRGSKGTDKKKLRLLCLTVKSGSKVRIYKLKDQGNGQYKEAQVWRLEEISALEADAMQLTLVAGKSIAFVGTTETIQDRDEFISIFLASCRKYLGQVPQLRGIDEKQLSNTKTSQVVAQRLSKRKQQESGLRPEGEDEEEEDDEDDTALLNYDWNVTDPSALEKQLFSELSGLESVINQQIIKANVYALIQCDNDLEDALERVDSALEELDSLEVVLKKFNVQLERLGQDIKQIEIQNNANQTQTTNQRTLLETLQEIMDTLSLPTTVLDVINNRGLENDDDIIRVTDAAQSLQKTLTAVFPGDVANMAAVEERLTEYREHRRRFSNRLSEQLEKIIETEMDCCLADKGRFSRKGELRLGSHDHIHSRLSRYQGLAEWLAAMDPYKLLALQKTYAKQFGRVYKRELRDFFENLRQTVLIKPQDEMDDTSLFNMTAKKRLSSKSTKNIESLKSRDVEQTRIPRENGKKETMWIMSSAEDKFTLQEAFRRMIQVLMPICSGEEKFISKFFPAAAIEPLFRLQRSNSTVNIPTRRPASIFEGLDSKSLWAPSVYDNTETSRSNRPGSVYDGLESARSDRPTSIFEGVESSKSNRPASIYDGRAGSIYEGKATKSSSIGESLADRAETNDDKDQAAVFDVAAQTLSESGSATMQTLFEVVQTELAQTVQAALKTNPTVAISLALSLVATFAQLRNEAAAAASSTPSTPSPSTPSSSSSSVFFRAILDITEKNKVLVVIENFVTDQIKAIADAKPSPKQKGIGLLKQIQNFPLFVESLESFASSAANIEAVRQLLDDAYRRIAEALLSSIVLSEDDTAAMDEKEQRNASIIIVENCHHLFTQMSRFKLAALDTCIKQSRSEYERHLSFYVRYMTKRALAKLYEFFDGVDTMLQNRKEEEVGFSLSFNKNACKKIVKDHPAKEMKKELQELYKRAARDYCGEEGLLPVVWRAIQEELIRLHHHYTQLIERCYPQSGIELGFTVAELLSFTSDVVKDTANNK